MNIELILFLIISALLLYTSTRVITCNNPVKSAVNLVFHSFFGNIVVVTQRRIFIRNTDFGICWCRDGTFFIRCHDARY